MGEFLIGPWRFALGVVDLEPGEGFVHGERPTVEQQASHLEGLLMAARSKRSRAGWRRDRPGCALGGSVLIFFLSKFVLFVSRLVIVGDVTGLVAIGLSDLHESHMGVTAGPFAVAHDIATNMDAMD